jgi:hypothetical protein
LESIISTPLTPLRSRNVAFLLSFLGAFAAFLQGCASVGSNPSPEPLEIATPSQRALQDENRFTLSQTAEAGVHCARRLEDKKEIPI